MPRRWQAGPALTEYTTGNFVSSGPHTFCGWLYVAIVDNVGTDCIYADILNGSSGGSSVAIGLLPTGQILFQEDSGSYDYRAVSITLNTWTHLALTNDGTTCRSYINGVQVNSGSYNPSGRANFVYFDMGCFGNNGDSQVQDVMVYSVQLSVEDIQRVMRLRKPAKAPSTGLYAWWPLHSGVHTRDFSGGQHTLNVDSSSAPTVFAPASWGAGDTKALRVFFNTSGQAGAAGIQSAASGTLSVSASLTGAAGIQSAASGTRSQTSSLVGAAGIQSAATAQLSVTYSLTGSAGIQSAAAAIDSILASLIGSAGIQSAAQASFGTQGLAGIQSAASGTVSVSAALSALSAIQSAAAGTLSVQIAEAGAAGIQSAASATISQLKALVASAGIQSAATGILSVTYSLQGTAGIQSAATGSPAGAPTNVGGSAGIASAASGVISVQFILDDHAIHRQPWSGYPTPRRRG